MLASTLHQVARSALATVGLYDHSLPASYDDGAVVPPLPSLDAGGPLSAAALDDAAADALRPRTAPTPAGFEPGLMEDLVGLALTRDAVEAVLDEMVRPALNADGGDISLVDIRDNDIYVKLVGACNTCPSSVMTMRMGVERLLQEEFPEMGELIQVDGDAY